MMIYSSKLLVLFLFFLTQIIIINMQAINPTPVGTRSNLIFGTIRIIDNLYSNSSNIISYQYTYWNTLSNGGNSFPKSYALGVHGFQSTAITNDLSLNVSILTADNAHLQMQAQVFGDMKLKNLWFSYLIVSYLALDIQAQQMCFVPTILSQGQGQRIQTLTGSTFFNYYSLSSQVYLTGFSISNTNGLYHNIHSTVNIPNGQSLINYSFKTYENNTIQFICFSTIIYSYQAVIDYAHNYATQFGSITFSYTQNDVTTSIPVPDSRYHDDYQRTFWGFSGFNLSRTIPRRIEFGLIDRTNWNAYIKTNIGTIDSNLNYFFSVYRACNTTGGQYWDASILFCVSSDATCSPNTVPEPTSFFCYYCYYTCSTCTTPLIDGCDDCSITFYRALNTGKCVCQSGYLDIGIQQCYPCNYFIPGCSTCSSKTICTLCQAGFILNGNSTCSCSNGFLISGICIQNVGCTNAVQFGGNIYCMACNNTLNFVRNNSNFLCQCKTGFKFVSQTCINICGDGLLVSGQLCDDGNLINGDGCSDTCQTQTGYQCVNNQTIQKSICLLIGNLILSLDYMERVQNTNQMVMQLSISPEYPEIYSALQFKSLISHNIPLSNSSYTVQYNQQTNKLLLTFDYNESLQSNNYTITLSPDYDYFSASSSITTLIIVGKARNAKLSYNSESILIGNQILDIIVIVLDVAALIILCLSVFSQTLIGIQMIQTLQSIFFALVIIGVTPDQLTPLKNFKYSSGYNIISGTDSNRLFNLNQVFTVLGYEKQFLLNFNIMLILILICLIILIIIKLVLNSRKIEMQKNFKKKSQYQNKFNSFLKIKKILNFLFQRVFFLIIFVSMFNIAFCVIVQFGTSQYSSQNFILTDGFNAFGAVLSSFILVCIITFIGVNYRFNQTKLFQFKRISLAYTFYYFLYQSFFIVIISVGYSYSFIAYIIGGLTIFNIIIILIINSYEEYNKTHKIILVFNQLCILFALGTYLTYQIFYSNSSNDSTFTQYYQTLYQTLCIVITSSMLLVLILNSYRLWIWRNYINSAYSSQQQQGKFQKFDFTDELVQQQMLKNKKKSKNVMFFDNNEILSKYSSLRKPLDKQIQSQQNSQMIARRNQQQKSSDEDNKENSEQAKDNQLELKLNNKGQQQSQEQKDILSIIKMRLKKDYQEKLRK